MFDGSVSYHAVLVNLWKPVLVFAGGLFVLHYLKRGLYRGLVLLQRNRAFSAGALHAVGRFATVLLYILLVLVTLRMAGFEVTGVLDTFAGFLAVLGVGMVAVWTILSNITATLFMVIWRPYQLGQHIEILPDGVKGKVLDSNLMYTEVEESQGTTVLIPNNLFFQKYVRRIPLPVKSTVLLSAQLRAALVASEEEDGPLTGRSERQE